MGRAAKRRRGRRQGRATDAARKAGERQRVLSRAIKPFVESWVSRIWHAAKSRLPSSGGTPDTATRQCDLALEELEALQRDLGGPADAAATRVWADVKAILVAETTKAIAHVYGPCLEGSAPSLWNRQPPVARND
jgi:hypothetical protein